MRGGIRQLSCWGVIRDYPAEATAQYEEFGQVTGAGELVVGAGVCSWEVVTAGKETRTKPFHRWQCVFAMSNRGLLLMF